MNLPVFHGHTPWEGFFICMCISSYNSDNTAVISFTSGFVLSKPLQSEMNEIPMNCWVIVFSHGLLVKLRIKKHFYPLLLNLKPALRSQHPNQCYTHTLRGFITDSLEIVPHVTIAVEYFMSANMSVNVWGIQAPGTTHTLELRMWSECFHASGSQNRFSGISCDSQAPVQRIHLI